MTGSEERYRQLIDQFIDGGELLAHIDNAARHAAARNRNQLLFSLFEAGLQYGIDLVLDSADILSRDFPRGIVDGSFECFSVGTECVKKKLASVIRESPQFLDFDFILTTHDGLYFYDLKTAQDFTGTLQD